MHALILNPPLRLEREGVGRYNAWKIVVNIRKRYGERKRMKERERMRKMQ